MVIWPIFIFIILADFRYLGILVALATFITALIVLWFGKITDVGERKALLRLGVLFAATSWTLRTLARGFLSILGLDLFYRISRNMIGVPLLAMTYENARNYNVVKESIFFEMSF